jgi:hypothetical protein
MYRWLLALLLVSASASAQSTEGTIDPGMTKQQVIERLGKPATVRTFQGTTYLLYSNSCGKSCGMQDLVVLDGDAVVDAVFRSPNRHYTGTSSSPVATKPNARSAHGATLAMPAPEPGAAEIVTPGTPARAPADSAHTSTSTVPADSARTPTSRPPADSAMTPTSAAPLPPYGKPSPTPPPADSAASSTSHPPVDNSTSSTSHPPKPPQ